MQPFMISQKALTSNNLIFKLLLVQTCQMPFFCISPQLSEQQL